MVRADFRRYALAGALAALLCAQGALAQQNPGQPGSRVEKSVSLTADRADIRATLKQLFTANGLNYTLDEAVSGTVTTTLKDVPFSTALHTVLRTAKTETPLTYYVENNIYSIRPRGAEAVEDARQLTTKLNITQASAEQIVKQLKQMPTYRESASLSYQANSVDNSIIIISTEDQLEALRMVLRMLDVQPKHISVKAELVLVAEGNTAKARRRVLWAPMVMGVNGQEMVIKTEVRNADLATWSAGMNSLKVKARVNGDNTITLDADWVADLTLHVDGQQEPIRISHTASGALSARSGETVVLTGAVIQLGGKAPDAELLLFLTPTLLPEKGPVDSSR